jgi:hypothetical protein
MIERRSVVMGTTTTTTTTTTWSAVGYGSFHLDTSISSISRFTMLATYFKHYYYYHAGLDYRHSEPQHCCHLGQLGIYSLVLLRTYGVAFPFDLYFLFLGATLARCVADGVAASSSKLEMK